MPQRRQTSRTPRSVPLPCGSLGGKSWPWLLVQWPPCDLIHILTHIFRWWPVGVRDCWHWISAAAGLAHGSKQHLYSITSSARGERGRNVNAERFGCLEIDGQLKLGWLLDGHAGGLRVRLLPGFDLDQVQQRRRHDHHQDATNTERDLHRQPLRDVEQRQVAGERQQNAEAVDWQRILATADRAAHHRRRQPSPIARHEPC